MDQKSLERLLEELGFSMTEFDAKTGEASKALKSAGVRYAWLDPKTEKQESNYLPAGFWPYGQKVEQKTTVQPKRQPTMLTLMDFGFLGEKKNTLRTLPFKDGK